LHCTSYRRPQFESIIEKNGGSYSAPYGGLQGKTKMVFTMLDAQDTSAIFSLPMSKPILGISGWHTLVGDDKV
jgi:hypothetical protein